MEEVLFTSDGDPVRGDGVQSGGVEALILCASIAVFQQISTLSGHCLDVHKVRGRTFELAHPRLLRSGT